jgi:predicted RNA-binding protein with PUA-like domain
VLVDVKYKADLKQLVSLEAMKALPELSEMRALQRGNRLSITPVTEAEFRAIQRAGAGN